MPEGTRNTNNQARIKTTSHEKNPRPRVSPKCSLPKRKEENQGLLKRSMVPVIASTSEQRQLPLSPNTQLAKKDLWMRAEPIA